MAVSLPTVESTSSSLLRRVQACDAEAWRRLTDLYGPLVYHWARQSQLQPADAADVAQEVFRSVSAAISGYRHDGAGRFRGWLRTITQNKIRDHFRRTRGQPDAAGGTDAQQRLLDVPQADDPEMPDDAQSHVVRRALALIEAEFEPTTWQAFWKTAVDQQRPADVAADLDLSVDSVYQAKSRVLRRLREELHDLL